MKTLLKVVRVLLISLFANFLYSFDFTNMISVLKSHQDKITSMTSEIAILMSTSQGKVGQKGLFWYSYPDKSRIDITVPFKQSTIFAGKKMYMILTQRELN